MSTHKLSKFYLMLIGVVIVLISIATYLGGLLALRFQDKQGLVMAFSAGVITGVFFFDLLPETWSLGTSLYHSTTLAGFMAAGFAVYLVLDRLSILHHSNTLTNARPGPMMAAAGLSLHGLFDGLAVGMAFTMDRSAGFILGLAVIMHSISDGFNTVVVVLRKGGLRSSSLWWLLVNSFAPLAGFAISFIYQPGQQMLTVLMAVFSGFFLYLGATDLLPDSLRSEPSWSKTAMTLLGLGIMFVASNAAA